MRKSIGMSVAFALMVWCGASPAAAEDQRAVQRVVVRDPGGQEVATYESSHALLIGVSEYSDGWGGLWSIPQEHDEIQALLELQGFEVERVSNPGSRKLKESVDDFIARHGYRPFSRLLIFFSGHGHTEKVLVGERVQRTGYIIPADTPDPQKDIEGFRKKAVSMEEVVVWAKKIKSIHALFLFDSCFSGTLFRTRDHTEAPKHISSRLARPVRQVLTAGNEDQSVPAQSVFAPVVIRGLEGEADANGDSYVTGTELGIFVHDEVVSYRTGQTPLFGTIRDPNLDLGDFVFPLTETMDANANLLSAIESDDLDSVLRFLRMGANPNAKVESSKKPLLYHSISSRKYQISEALVRFGAHVNNANGHSWATPLAYAAVRGELGLVQTLLEHDAEMNIATPVGPLLNLVARIGKKNPETIQLLIDNGANPSAKHARTGRNVLHDVVATSDKYSTETVDFLVDIGVNVEARTRDDSRTPLILATRNGNVRGVVDLLSHGANPYARDSEGKAALDIAQEAGNDELVRTLEGHIDRVSQKFNSDLQAAFERGDAAKVEVALKAGADPGFALGGTPILIKAVQGGQVDIAKLLVNRGALLSGHVGGKTALCAAVESNGVEMVEFLLEKGADVDAGAPVSPLMLAVSTGSKMTQLLMKHGADAEQINSGYTALIWAAGLGYTDGLLELLNQGANPDTRDSEGCTALIHAARTGEGLETARLLLEHKADFHARCNDGRTAMDAALLSANEDKAEVLQLFVTYSMEVQK